MKIAHLEDQGQIEEILRNVRGETMISGGELPLWFERGFFLLDDHGMFWCSPVSDDTLEVHATFDNEYRGHYARDLGMEAQRMLFTELSITRMITKCKVRHKNVVAFTKWIGFHEIGLVGEDRVLECSLDSYIMLDHHLGRLTGEFPLPSVCPQEQANYAGFFMECSNKGMLLKGLQTYNRMASLLHWQPLIITSDNPILLTVGDKQFSPTVVPSEA